MDEIGNLLRQSRQQLGLTLEDIQAATHINVVYLQDLEEERFEALPHPGVARGFLRNYAAALNLDVDYVLGLYDDPDQKKASTSGNPGGRMQFKSISMARPSRISSDLVLAILFLVLVGVAVVGVFYTYGDTFTAWTNELMATPVMPTADTAFVLPTPTPAPTPTPTSTVTPTPAFYTGVTVELVFNDDSWVQVLTDGDKAFEGILQAGEQRHWRGEKRVAVRVGNAGGVEAIVNGQSMGVMGEPGAVVDQVWEMLEEGAVTTATPPAPVTEEAPPTQ